MENRILGQSGLKVSKLCLGGNVFGWTADEAASFEILDAFVAAGGNFIDTADVYSRWLPGHVGGESETVIGKWLASRGNREGVIIATKLGMEMGPGLKGLGKKYVSEAVEASLRRLQTDYIDLYQSHRDDPETPLRETLEAYASLIEEGKVRVIAKRLREAVELAAEGLPRYESLQPHYNLVERAGYEAELEPVCEELHLGVIPYFSLASGFLTGKYRSEADLGQSPRGRGASKYLNEKGGQVLAALDEVSARLNANPAQVSLAWLMARPSITAPIASATSAAQLADLVAAADLKLDADAIAVLDRASG